MRVFDMQHREREPENLPAAMVRIDEHLERLEKEVREMKADTKSILEKLEVIMKRL
jgi:hypothetical protein